MTLTWDPRSASRHLAAADPRFAAVIKRIGPCTMQLDGQADPFRALLRSIVYQQLSGKAAATILGRVHDLFPRQRPRPEALAGITDAQLRAAGMSGAKVAAVRDLADKVMDGTIPTLARLKRLDDEAVKACLTQVRGVGPWTVEMYLMFWLGRPDVLPVGDLGVRKGFMIGWNKRKMPEPEVLAKHGRRWAPYRTAASWYLWRLVDTDDAW